MDAFIVAFRFPNLVRGLFAEGAMSAALVPTFTRHVAVRGTDEAWRLGNYVINALLLFTGVVVVLGATQIPRIRRIVKDFRAMRKGDASG